MKNCLISLIVITALVFILPLSSYAGIYLSSTEANIDPPDPEVTKCHAEYIKEKGKKGSSGFPVQDNPLIYAEIIEHVYLFILDGIDKGIRKDTEMITELVVECDNGVNIVLTKTKNNNRGVKNGKSN